MPGISTSSWRPFSPPLRMKASPSKKLLWPVTRAASRRPSGIRAPSVASTSPTLPPGILVIGIFWTRNMIVLMR